MDADSPLLKLEGVSKDYVSGDGAPPLRVLREVRLEVRAGDTVAVVGPSGSGKSTLLNIIGTLDRSDAGRVLFEGKEISAFDAERLAVFRNTRIGFVFQAHHLLPQCTAFENVLVPSLARDDKAARQAAVERARRLLDRVGLGGRLNHFPGQLSGGERQRVAVVRALVNAPALLLADEPTGALDRASADALGQLLVELNREERLAMIVATHAPALADRMGRILRLEEGRLVEEPRSASAAT